MLPSLPAELIVYEARAIGPNQIEVVCAHGDGSALAALDALRNVGLVIKDITSKEAGLEELFLHLTSRKE